MNQRLLYNGIIVSIGLLFSACGQNAIEVSQTLAPAATQTSVQVSTQTLEPAQVGYVTSSFYGYSLTLPDGWKLTRAATMLMVPGQIPWAGESDAVDTFRGPGNKDFMVVGARTLGASVTIEAWANAVGETTLDICQEKPSTQNQMEIGGELAIVVVDGDCQGIDHLWLAVLHEGLGFQIVWAGGDREAFEAIRQTFTFTP